MSSMRIVTTIAIVGLSAAIVALNSLPVATHADGSVSGGSTWSLVSEVVASSPMTTATRLPPIDPTPHGSAIAVGTPLPTPSIGPNAIVPGNVSALVEDARLTPPTGREEAVVGFTQDGARLVSTTDFSRVIVRRMPDGGIVRTIEGVGNSSYGATRISPDGMLLATCNQFVAGFVDLWGLESGYRLRQHRGGEQVRALLFASDGQHLMAARVDGSAQVWGVADGTMTFHERLSSGFDEAVISVNPVRDEWATAGDGVTVHLRDIAIGEVRSTLRSASKIGTIKELHYSPDGGALIAAVSVGGDWHTYRHRVVMWQDEREVGHMSFRGHRFIYGMKWDPTGRRLAVWTDHGLGGEQAAKVWLWDGRTSAPEIMSEANHTVRGLAWSADGALLFVGLAQTYSSTGVFPGETVAWDVVVGSVVRRLSGVVDPWVAPDGATLVVRGDGVVDRDLRLFTVDPALVPTPSATPTATDTSPPSLTATRESRPATATATSAPAPVSRILAPWASRSRGH